MIYLGNSLIKPVGISRVYLGNSLVYQKAIGKNLLNPYTVNKEGKFINKNNGNPTTPSDSNIIWYYSDYIEIKPNTNYYFGQINSSGTTAGTAWYDENKEFISGINASKLITDNNILMSPSNAMYLRHSFRVGDEYNNNWENTVYICESGTLDHWIPFVYDGYTPISAISFDSGKSYFVTDAIITGADTLRISYMANANCNVVGSYASGGNENYSIYHSATAYIRYDGVLKKPSLSHNVRYNMIMSPTGLYDGETQLTTWDEKSFTCVDPLWIGMLPNSSVSSLSGVIYGNVELDGKFLGIPYIRNSDSAIGYYDVYTDYFYENEGNGTISAIL